MGESAYIQEWPEDKLTLAQLRAVVDCLSEDPRALDREQLAIGEKKLIAALKKAEDGVEPPRKAESPVFFFGCMKGAYGYTQSGHYFYAEGPHHDRRPHKSEWLGEGILPATDIKIDGGFVPHYQGDRQYAKARLTHYHGWTAIGWWDSSGDTRPGSDSNFFMKGILDFEDALDEARRAFDQVIRRCEAVYGRIELVHKVFIR